MLMVLKYFLVAARAAVDEFVRREMTRGEMLEITLDKYD